MIVIDCRRVRSGNSHVFRLWSTVSNSYSDGLSHPPRLLSEEDLRAQLIFNDLCAVLYRHGVRYAEHARCPAVADVIDRLTRPARRIWQDIKDLPPETLFESRILKQIERAKATGTSERHGSADTTTLLSPWREAPKRPKRPKRPEGSEGSEL